METEVEATRTELYIDQLHNTLENDVNWQPYNLDCTIIFNQLLTMTSAQQKHEMVEDTDIIERLEFL